MRARRPARCNRFRPITTENWIRWELNSKGTAPIFVDTQSTTSPSRGGLQGADVLFDRGQQIPFRDFQVVARLQIEPELGRRAEVDGQPQGGIGADAAPAVNDIPDNDIYIVTAVADCGGLWYADGLHPSFPPSNHRPAMNRQRCLSFILAFLVCVPAVASQAGENIAKGKKYTLSPAPNYEDCKDPGDTTQLTDGKTTGKYFWTQKETVGWRHTAATITVDLGKIEPIRGVSFHTAAGAAQVQWPTAILIWTSDDGKNFYDTGNLVAMDLKAHGPWPQGYAIRELSTTELRARGRYVRFVVIGTPYIFCDEVGIFRGPAELLQAAPKGRPTTADDQLIATCKQLSCIQLRYESDIQSIAQAIEKAPLANGSVRDALQRDWRKAAEALRAADMPNDNSFRAVLPYNDAHARLFQVQAALWKTQGRADLTYSAPAAWDPTDLVALPNVGGRIEVHAMRGEYRAGAVNLANASDKPMEVKVHFEGLPGSPAPDYLTLHEVPWTDTLQGRPVAAALPLARREGAGWRVTVLPGMVRQLWLTFHVEQASAGDYRGKLVIESAQSKALHVPVRLQVYPLEFPKQTTLQLGGWDDTDGKGHYGMTPQNRKAFIEHLQERKVNAPWATAQVMMRYGFTPDGSVKLDTELMDQWIAEWPRAQMYYVFLAIGDAGNHGKKQSFGGAEAGTAEFDRKVGAWISAWVRHLGGKGIPPERLGLLIFDELNEKSNISGFLAWAKAIRAAEPKVVIWEDPIYADPSKAPPELFEACDVLCPNRPAWLARGDSYGRFYREQQRKGRTLHFYSCSGPARLLDPYSYYRLQAWHCWQIGATGSFFWAFGDNSGASSWNEYQAKAGPYAPLYLDPTSVTPGKQMEAIRESVEDYEYFVMLRDAVAKAKAAGRADSVIAAAESLLATAADEVLAAHGASELFWHTAQDRTRADAARVRLIDSLLLLKKP
jgi:hypothetical protein